MSPISFRFKQILAFAAIYLIWGSTFLGIRYAIETLPGFTMAAVRFLIAGLIFLAWSWWRGEPMPTVAHWRSAALIGAMLLLLGNGAVVWVEHRIATGLTALLIATEPVWIVILLWLEGERPSGRMAAGVALGFTGAAFLAAPGVGDSDAVPLIPALVAVLGSLSWAAGSLYGRKASLPRSVVQASGMQMVSGGLLLALAGLVSGEWWGLDLATASTRSWLALAFLMIFGSLIGFTAYGWLMRTTSPSLVATYAFVNPLVAVFLGWFLAGEKVGVRILAAAILVVASVVLVSGSRKARLPSAWKPPAPGHVDLGP